jgi:hypothetical protein
MQRCWWEHELLSQPRGTFAPSSQDSLPKSSIRGLQDKFTMLSSMQPYSPSAIKFCVVAHGQVAVPADANTSPVVTIPLAIPSLHPSLGGSHHVVTSIQPYDSSQLSQTPLCLALASMCTLSKGYEVMAMQSNRRRKQNATSSL